MLVSISSGVLNRQAMRWDLHKFTLALAIATASLARAMAGPSDSPELHKQALRSYPTDGKTYYALGLAHTRKSEWDKAINNFSEALRHNPQDALAYEARGSSYFMKREFDKAVSDFTRAIELSPTNFRTYLNRGGVYRVQGEFDKAIQDFSDCVRLNPTNDLAFKTRAACYSAKGEFAKEIQDWTEGLRLKPADARALASRAYAYSMTREFEKAIGDYRKVLQLEPTNYPVLNELAWLQATCPSGSVRDGKEAARNATRACELSHWEDAACIDTLAAALAEAGDFEKAVRCQKQALGMKDVAESDRLEMRKRLSLYEQGRPYREEPKPKPLPTSNAR